jgi:hypothetical protein
MKKGDLFIFTTLSSIGVDIRALWEKSKSVSPPHHLNFLNPNSMKILLERTGFKFLEATTPGKLDIDIMDNNRSDLHDRFWEAFSSLATPEDKSKMQKLISELGFSSHMMIVAELKNIEIMMENM